MRVTVFGPGGVGGYLAARIAAADVADVSVVARGAHLSAIRSHGLHLESPQGDLHVRLHATDDPDSIGPVDLVLITVKSTDVPSVAERLPALVGDDTSVVTLQNGIDSPRLVAQVVGEEHVFPGVAYVFSTVADPGHVRHTAGPGRFVFGPSVASTFDRARRIGEFLTDAGVENEVVDDVDVALWSKFAIICSTAGVTATSRLPIDVLRGYDVTEELFGTLVREVIDVGRASGVALPASTFDEAMQFIRSIGSDAYSSLLYDLVNGKPMELEALHGAIVRLASELEVDVPATRTVHALLFPWADRGAHDLNDLDGTFALTERHSGSN